MKKGFTLVELSIVLVVIGLLIGGILSAQSMINTAKIQGVVRQLQQYDVAVANFQTKYGQLPGDTNLFGNHGNNDGKLDTWGTEGSNFWSDLSLGVGLKNSSGDNYQITPYYSATINESNCPKFNVNQDLTNQPCLGAVYFVQNSMTSNYYQYMGANNGGAGILGGSPMYSKDVLAVDIKIDDGKPITGNVNGCDSGGNVYCVSSQPSLLQMTIGSINNTAN